MSLTKKEVDELKPVIDRVVQKVVGFSEPTLVTAAINCIDKGYDEKKTAVKMGSIIDQTQADLFAERLFTAYDDYRTSLRGRKRKDVCKPEDLIDVVIKKKKLIDQIPPEPGQPSPGQLTADKIKDMMANAQKMIQNRKAQLGAIGEDSDPLSTLPEVAPSLSQQQVMMNDAMLKAKKAAELQARIQSQLQRTGLGLRMPGTTGHNATGRMDQSQPTPLILDEQGRTIDATTGEAVQLTHHMPTLKANIRAKKREQFKAVIQDKAPEEMSESKYFDARVGVKNAGRLRRGFRFHEEGKFQQLASRLRTKAQLEKLQGEIAQAAKKTGIASAAKLATLQPKTETDPGHVPSVEWWDAVILKNETYESLSLPTSEGKDKLEGITHLIEHPSQIQSPAEPTKRVQIAVMLTKKERKKLRRQNRNEAQKELTEKIRLGLMPPPEPKVRMANLMRVLGTEAVQDPTKVEAHVRSQMAKRVREHEEANAARKLTKEQRSEKKSNKLKEDTSLGVSVCIYRIKDMNNPARKFKVETNAKQLHMTGMVILHKDCNVVVVEGGPKQQKKFRRLMLRRIKWSEETKGKASRRDDDSDEEKVVNTCSLVWEGMVKTRSFGEMKFKMCPTESFAREQFNKHSVPQYWDLAYSGSVLEAAGDDIL